jgi:hypothetical protein
VITKTGFRSAKAVARPGRAFENLIGIVISDLPHQEFSKERGVSKRSI